MAGLAGRRAGKTASGVQLFDAPVRVPSSRATAIALTIATGALLVVTVPLYFVFLLNNLGDVFVMMANMRAASARATGAASSDADAAAADAADADAADADDAPGEPEAD